MSGLVLAFLGDVVGRPGRRAVASKLGELRREHRVDFVVANGENARNGSGITPKHYHELRDAGVDLVTLGDHAYRDESIFPLLDNPADPIIRPANLPKSSPGKRFLLLPPVRGASPICVVTVLGRIFFPLPADDPFACVDEVLETVPANAIVVVEAHMEATSEKAALAHHLDGRVAAVIGTHTHVPTADARVLPHGTAFVTDLGMCGPFHSILGREIDPVVYHMRTARRAPFGVAEEDPRLMGAIVRMASDGVHAASIERVEYRVEESTSD